MKKCEICSGKGTGYFSCCDGFAVDEDIAMCHTCHEHLGEEDCENCNGTGEVEDDVESTIEKVPDLILQAERLIDSLNK